MKLETSKYLIDYSNEDSQGIDITSKTNEIKVGVYISDRNVVIIDVRDKYDKLILYQELSHHLESEKE